MKNINNSCVNIENNNGLLTERYKLEGNKIKLPTFWGKDRYLVPIKIVIFSSAHEYLINILKKYNNLEYNKNYYINKKNKFKLKIKFIYLFLFLII